MASASRRRIDPISDQLLMDLQSYIFQCGDVLKFADIVTAFPGIHPLTLIQALVELEKKTIISFSTKHNALFVRK